MKTKKPEDRYGDKKIVFLEHVNEIELIVGIVGIAVAFIYQGIWVALGVAIGVVFLESIILVEISTAKNVVKLRKQNERIERYLYELKSGEINDSDEKTAIPFSMTDEDDQEEYDPYKWFKIVGWSVFFITVTLVVNHFFP